MFALLRFLHRADRIRRPGGAASFADLFHSPAHAGAGFSEAITVETYSDIWYSTSPALDSLPRAYAIAELVAQDAVSTLDALGAAWLPLHPGQQGLPEQSVLGLGRRALHTWDAVDPPLPVDAGRFVDMSTPLSDLRRMLLAARHDWDRTERLAIQITGLDEYSA